MALNMDQIAEALAGSGRASGGPAQTSVEGVALGDSADGVVDVMIAGDVLEGVPTSPAVAKGDSVTVLVHGGSPEVVANSGSGDVAQDATEAAQTDATQAISDAADAQEDATQALADAAAAAKTATNFMEFQSGTGLVIGDKTSGSWSGTRTKVDSDSFDVLAQDGTVLSSFGADEVDLGKNSSDSIIKLCDDAARVRSSNGNASFWGGGGDVDVSAIPNYNLAGWVSDIASLKLSNALYDQAAGESASGSFSVSSRYFNEVNPGVVACVGGGVDIDEDGNTSSKTTLYAGYNDEQTLPTITLEASSSGGTIELSGGTVSMENALPVSSGGTGASTAAGARTALGAAAADHTHPGISTPVQIADGGTGSTTAAAALAALGAAAAAHTHDASDVASGALPVANGGTGASTAAAALTALGAVGAADVLYANSSGTTSALTLSASAANYSYLEIFFARTGVAVNAFASVKVTSPNGKAAALVATSATSTGLFSAFFSHWKISGASVSPLSEYYLTMNSSGISSSGPTSAQTVRIFKVLGWK